MRILYVSLFILITDQISKLAVKGFNIPFLNLKHEGMNLGESFSVIGDFFRITFVENPGMAFGINVGVNSKLLLSLFSFIASIGLIYYIYKIKNESYVNRLSLALILGGALGNFIDRAFYGVFYDYAPLMYGRVVDFFQVEFWDFTIFGKTYETWPIFNVADASVTVGVILMLIFHGRIYDEKDKSETDETKVDLAEEENLDGKDNNRKNTESRDN
ncbi:MAG: signal peptidase II [Melioribacteraceae bacterium]|nr:signal peptidase II [Melioribacteraceae bacterium]RJP58633.1 MAG: signal peptidase II [Ignavibacteriales bacterium]WKZ70616.1 MAG: signal peptidase II [Melioribacteraceae bacterium]